MGKFDTHGGYFAPQDYFRVNTGGSHEENPNGGVQVGVDQNGTPNLLEEGEPVYKDFVFSDNIKANKSILKEFGIPEKYAGMLYSEIADKLIEEAEERPMDSISRNGLDAMLGRLADAQEAQKLRKEESELKAELNKLPPEELAMLAQNLGQANAEETPVMQPQMMPQEMSQEQMAMAPQQQMYMPENMPMMAMGGLLHEYGNGGPVNVYEDGTPAEGGWFRDNWDRLKYIGAGALGVGALGAMSGAAAGGVGALPGALLGAIDGGILANDIYNQDPLAIGLDVALPFVGKGLIGAGKYAAGKSTKVATLNQVKSAASRVSAKALKLEAKRDAVKSAETELKMAANKFKTNTSKLSQAQATIEKYIGKKDLTEAEKTALKDAEAAYAAAAKEVSTLEKEVNKTGKELVRADIKLWWAERKNPFPYVAKATQAVDKAVWKPAKYLFDPTAALKSQSSFPLPQIIGASVNDAAVLGGRAALPFLREPVEYDTVEAVPVDNVTSPSQETTRTVETGEPAYPFAQGGVVNRFVRGGYIPYDNSNGFMYFNTDADEYDEGYRDWVTGSKFLDNGVFDELSKYYKATTGLTLTKSNAIKLGLDKKFGKFHDIMGQAYTNYLNSRRAADMLPHLGSNALRAGAGAKSSYDPRTGVQLPKLSGLPQENIGSLRGISRSLAHPNELISLVGKNRFDELNSVDNVEDVELDSKTQAIINDSLNRAIAGEYSSKKLSTLPRYAGIAQNLLSAAYNLAQSPDKYVYQSLNSYFPEGRMPLQMQSYTPMDMSIPMQAVRAQGQSTARSILNSGAGPTIGQLLLANGFNTANAFGNTLLQGWQANRQLENSIIAANNQARAQMSNFDATLSARRAELANQMALNNQQMALKIAMLNNQAEQDKASAVSMALDNAAKGLAGIGNENFVMNQINDNPYLLRYIRPDGTSVYSGKCGGLLKKYKK